MKRCGILGIIVQGASKRWQYLVVKEDGTADTLTTDLGKKEREISVLSIGPAGENLVKWSGIVVDKGHAAMHNGIGAVMGSKKLKAVERGTGLVPHE